MSTRSVSALWIGGPLGPYERLCLTSFVRSGFAVQLFTFDDSLPVPPGVVRRMAGDILPAGSVFENVHERGTFAAYSNVFRYRLLQLEDTTWVDADVLSVADELPGTPYLFGDQGGGLVNGAVLHAPSDSPFLAHLYDVASSTDPGQIVWGQLGPTLITRTIQRFGLEELVQEQQVLYPVHWDDLATLFDPQGADAVEDGLRGAATVHLWNEILRRAGAPVKQVRPPTGSWLDRKFRELEVDFESSHAHDPVWVLGAVRTWSAGSELAGTRAERDAALVALEEMRGHRDAAVRRSRRLRRRLTELEQSRARRPAGWLRGLARGSRRT